MVVVSVRHQTANAEWSGIRGRTRRLRSKQPPNRWPNLLLVHLPIHASWLNQIEIVFSILQRQVLTPNAFESLFELEDSILAFEERYTAIANPFDWKYTRRDLARLLARLTAEPNGLKTPA
ncbi:MAG: hypothetical protein ABI442_15330 [Gemmatimonadaceae bacterium]